jgi:LPXTG-motif cell wall-anchored protein
MRKLMMLAAMVAVALLAASPALAQDEPAVVADAKAKEAKAGGATAEAECKDGYIVSKAGGVVAKAPCEPEPPKAAPPPPPAPAPAPAPAPPKALPQSGGIGAASLFALGAGALLVGGGLLVRRFVR